MIDSERLSASHAFPLRKRGTMEIFDISIKLYKRYFVPVIPWSILAGIINVLGAVVPGAGLLSFLFTPFLIGAVACCMKAALRGVDVTASECWEFSKKRYGPILGISFLSGLVAFAIAMVAMVAMIVPFFLLSFLTTSSANSSISFVILIIFIALIAVAISIVFTCLFAWMKTVPIAVCLEGDGKNTTPFLRRVYDLMSGHWRSIFGLVSLIGLAVLALFLIIGAAGAIILGGGIQLKSAINSTWNPSEITGWLIAYLGTFSLVTILVNPFLYIALSVQYLDLRVRKEALDLEWAAQDYAEGGG